MAVGGGELGGEGWEMRRADAEEAAQGVVEAAEQDIVAILVRLAGAATTAASAMRKAARARSYLVTAMDTVASSFRT